jgi:hypothetical protein
LPLADGELANVVGEGAIEKRGRARSADTDFTHVRDVKNARGFADSEMLVHDAGILDGHLPPAEFDQFTTEPLMGGEERSSFQ